MYKVLLIDDCDFTRTAIIYLLHKLGCKVFDITNKDEVIKCAEDNDVEVVISDWHIHDYTGEIIIQLLRNNSRLCHLPIAVLTSDEFVVKNNVAVKAGADICLKKPIKSEALEVWLTSLKSKAS